ncbi:MAG: sugar transferase [Candidatus Hodarchaeota archaeon]
MIKRPKFNFFHDLSRLKNFDCSLLWNFYSLDDFQQKLFIEKRRVERLNLKTSIVIFKFLKFFNEIDNKKKPVVNIEYLLHIICTNIRKTDVVSLYDESTVLILLPETDSIGAQVMCERVTKIINESLEREFLEDKFKNNFIKIDIISYPEKLTRKKQKNRLSNDKTNENHNTDLSFITPSKNINFNQQYFKTNNLCFSTNSGSSTSIPLFDVFFWDQELITDLFFFIKKFIKRIMDIFGAIILLTSLSPFMLISVILIRLTSSGSIIFKQERIGFKGKYFTCFKFRTMYQNKGHKLHEEYVKKLIHGENSSINTGSESNPCFKIKADPRVTPIGKVLRKTSLDELPQLFNVLKGEMSLVGPRPPILYEVEEYKNWHFRRILEVKPGITGLWQVMGRNKTTFDEMVRLDIRYAENWSILLDIKIILKTIFVVLNLGGQ